MKNSVGIVAFCLGVVIAGGVLWYGNQPVRTYYPSGALQSEVSRSFFKRNGIYRVYDEQSKLILEVPYVDDKKTGIQKEYFSNGKRREIIYQQDVRNGITKEFDEKKRLVKETPYSNDIISGTEKVYTKGDGRFDIPYVNNVISGKVVYIKDDEKIGFVNYNNGQRSGAFEWGDDISGKFTTHNQFEANITADDYDGTVRGKVVEDDDWLYDFLAESDDLGDWSTSPVISIEHFDVTYTDENVEVEYNGAFKFPQFTQKSVITVKLPEEIFQEYENVLNSLNMPAEIKPLVDYYLAPVWRITIQEDNKTILLEGLNSENKKLSSMILNMKDISKFIEALDSADEDDAEKILIKFFKSIEIRDVIGYSMDEKPEIKLTGGFYPYLMKFSDDAAYQIYNSDGKIYANISGIKNGLKFSFSYPKTVQDFISFNVVTDLRILKDFQKQLRNVKTFEDYATVGYSLGMNMATNPPKKVTVNDLAVKDASGQVIVSSERFQFDIEQKKMTGKITVVAPDGVQMDIAFKGNPEVVWMTARGETIKVATDEMLDVLKSVGLDKTFQKMGEEYLKQLSQMPKTIAGSGAALAVKAYQKNEEINDIIDMAMKYAVFARVHYQTYRLMHDGDDAGYVNVDLCAAGLVKRVDGNCAVNGATYRVFSVDEDRVSVRIDFDDSEMCRKVAGKLSGSVAKCDELTSHLFYYEKMY